jgi:XrtN system VIT domain protein
MRGYIQLKEWLILNIQNDWSQEEALMRIKLPEGSAVSSLSLWIGGKEEPAILTTKGKADTAYNTIVGVMRRDPSLITWKEGNEISVKIFPCTPKEMRQIKIGVTSPLTEIGDNTTFQNIEIQGINTSKTNEKVMIEMMDNVKLDDKPSFLSRKNNIYKGEHLFGKWDISVPSTGRAYGAFSFDNNTYILSNHQVGKISKSFDEIYLDINKNWTTNEVNHIRNTIKGKKVFVNSNQLIELNKDNSSDVIEEVLGQNFSLFPYYKIKNVEKALVITKGNSATPNLSDLTDAIFNTEIKKYSTQSAKISVINIGSKLSPLEKTLEEKRDLLIFRAELDEVLQVINKNEFIRDDENDSLVIIPSSNLQIEKVNRVEPKTGPDHLFRMYAYNECMRSMSLQSFDISDIESPEYKLASMANIVTPLSSLIVLETQADYDRFDIKKDEKSIGNASLSNAGSVPEPHEWALIFILCFALLYYTQNRKLVRIIN